MLTSTGTKVRTHLQLRFFLAALRAALNLNIYQGWQSLISALLKRAIERSLAHSLFKKEQMSNRSFRHSFQKSESAKMSDRSLSI